MGNYSRTLNSVLELILGLSTIVYMAMAVYFTASIQFRAALFCSHIRPLYSVWAI